MHTVEHLGVVAEDERDRIQQIYMRKTALMELMLTLAQRGLREQNDLYQRVLNDLASATQDMTEWWSLMCHRYNWTPPITATWHIDFGSCEVTLLVPEQTTGQIPV